MTSIGRWSRVGILLAAGCGSSLPAASGERRDGDAPLLPDAGGCNGLASSDLPGVSLAFPDQPCAYTVAQVAAGIEIDYQEQIVQALADLRPSQWDDGRCQTPDDAGLIVGYEISGAGQSYCRCDVGLCPAQTFDTAVVAGTHGRQIPWDGRNWDGPSDTGNPEGAPFPPGTYTLALTATGTRADSPDASGSSATPFTVTATRFITITP
ncbi:MAG TPA: hypothetical protein VH853_24760 [Polyangia bacterium]|nr:hypothetical protein [Polyangia bacterium]